VTLIENRADWAKHRMAFNTALTGDVCFVCATELGFRETNKPIDKRMTVKLHPRCERMAREAA
jgi:hypothetical protein